MKYFIVLVSLFSSIAFGQSDVDLIKKHVELKFQPLALSLLQHSDVDELKVVDDRVVISLNTKGLFFDLKVENGVDSFQKKKALKIVHIPFPKKGDTIKCFGDLECLSADYHEALKGLGLSQTSTEVVSTEEMDFYFMTIKNKRILKAEQKIYVGFRLTKEGSSFDNKSLGFFVNGCDSVVCWGARGISLELQQR